MVHNGIEYGDMQVWNTAAAGLPGLKIILCMSLKDLVQNLPVIIKDVLVIE